MEPIYNLLRKENKKADSKAGLTFPSVLAEFWHAEQEY